MLSVRRVIMCRNVVLTVLVMLAAAVRPVSSTDFIEYYSLLGVSRDAPTSELKKNFRKRSVELHPDKNRAANAVEQFQMLRTAYECLLDPKSRSYYDTYRETWAEMKEYKEKHLTSTQRQMFQQGGRMFMRDVEVNLEEMFWGDQHVQILHQSFAAKLLGNFPGVWVLFFGNPHCGPCRKTAPQISHFARQVAAQRRDWLRVGTVNMGADANEMLLNHFGAAAQRIPQVILVAPSGGSGLGLGARLADFEIFDRGNDNAQNFSRRLLGAAEQLRASAVPALDVPPGTDLGPAVAAAQRGAGAGAAWSADADPRAKWVVLVVDGSNASAGLAPVFRRLAQRSRHAGFVFRVLRCGGDGDDGAPPAASARACGEAASFPELRLYGPAAAGGGAGQPELLLATRPSQLLSGAAEDAQRYGYDLEQAGFGIFLEGVFRASSPDSEGRYPRSLRVAGCTGSLFINGPFALIGTSNERPLYKRPNQDYYLRWLLPSQRGSNAGAWIISDTPEPLDQGWAYMEQDQLVPIGEGWMVLSEQRGRKYFNLQYGMSVVNGEDWAVRSANRKASHSSEL